MHGRTITFVTYASAAGWLFWHHPVAWATVCIFSALALLWFGWCERRANTN